MLNDINTKSHLFYNTILFLFFINSSVAQNITASEKFNIQFESTEYLTAYKTESENIIGYQNSNFAVDIEKIDVQKSTQGKLEDLKKITKQIALDFGFTDLGAGGIIPNEPNSYYIRGYDKENNRKLPVYVAIIHDVSNKIIYQITIDCYNGDRTEGTKITRSFKLLK